MARPKGAQNKVGAQVKENILAVFTRLGSTAAMAEWAKAHQTDFYKMYASLAPKEIDAVFTVRDERDLTDDELADIATGRSAGAAEPTQGETQPPELH